MFRNLIANAGKYNEKPEKWVEVGYRDEPAEDIVLGSVNGNAITADGTVFYVRDNGIGIREKHKNDVFRMFKRLHGRNAFGGGTGAELSIVEKIIKNMLGRSGSNPNSGSARRSTSPWHEGTPNGQNFDTAIASG